MLNESMSPGQSPTERLEALEEEDASAIEFSPNRRFKIAELQIIVRSEDQEDCESVAVQVYQEHITRIRDSGQLFGYTGSMNSALYEFNHAITCLNLGRDNPFYEQVEGNFIHFLSKEDLEQGRITTTDNYTELIIRLEKLQELFGENEERTDLIYALKESQSQQ